jgi:APA family basic amino acid/polyamine antiporter
MHRVSSRGAPAATTLFYGAFTMAFAGLLTLGAAVDIVNIGTLFAFAMVILAVWVFRIRRPDIERPFRMPLWSVWTKDGRPLLPLLSILGIIGIAIMVASLDKFTILASVTWAGLGFIVYAFYGVRNSKEAAERHAAQAGAAPPPRPSLTVATRDD